VARIDEPMKITSPIGSSNNQSSSDIRVHSRAFGAPGQAWLI
jgi:hypothetical protein